MATITESQKRYLLSLKPEDLTFDCLVDMFGDKLPENGDISKVRKSRFETTDEMVLTPGEYFVKERTSTTVGRFIWNKYIVERCNFQDILGYVNIPLTKGASGKNEAILAKALIDDKITIEQMYKYIDARDNLGMQLHSVICTSFTMNTIKTPAKVKKRREELFKQYSKEIADGDIFTAEKIENELVTMAKNELKGDVGLDLYNSEARGNFGNYKNMNIMKGATHNAQTGKYDIVTSSFMDGIKKEDIPSFGSAVVAGSYPKSVGTQESGYYAKELLSSMQSEVLDEHGSDCHTTGTIEVLIDDRNVKDLSYRYIVENGKYVCLTPEVMQKYKGKVVKLRSPMYCKGDKICNICGGELPYKLGTTNVGLGCSKIATALLRMGMKKFHISNLKSNQINLDDMLI